MLLNLLISEEAGLACRAPHLFAGLLRCAGVAPALLPLLAEPARAAVAGLAITARRKRPAHNAAFLAALREICTGARSDAAVVSSFIWAEDLFHAPPKWRQKTITIWRLRSSSWYRKRFSCDLEGSSTGHVGYLLFSKCCDALQIGPRFPHACNHWVGFTCQQMYCGC